MKYVNVLIEKGYFDERPVFRARNAVVELGVATIGVMWKEGPRKFNYEGTRTGQGHFVLSGDAGVASATLHRFQHSSILEGFWKRGNRSGFWRLHLPADNAADIIQLPKAKAAAAVKPKKRRKPARRVSMAA